MGTTDRPFGKTDSGDLMPLLYHDDSDLSDRALTELRRRYDHRLAAVIAPLLAEVEGQSVEDALQDLWIRVLTRPLGAQWAPGKSSGGEPWAWLQALAANGGRQLRRQARRRRKARDIRSAADLDQPDGHGGVEPLDLENQPMAAADWDSQHAESWIARAFETARQEGSLSDEEAAVFEAVYRDQLDQRTIAWSMGIPEYGVSRRLHSARRKIVEVLQREGCPYALSLNSALVPRNRKAGKRTKRPPRRRKP